VLPAELPLLLLAVVTVVVAPSVLRRSGAIGRLNGDDVTVHLHLAALHRVQADGDGDCRRRAERRHAVAAGLGAVPAVLPFGAVKVLELNALHFRGDDELRVRVAHVGRHGAGQHVVAGDVGLLLPAQAETAAARQPVVNPPRVGEAGKSVGVAQRVRVVRIVRAVRVVRHPADPDRQGVRRPLQQQNGRAGSRRGR
jgi:hypothetical protein